MIKATLADEEKICDHEEKVKGVISLILTVVLIALLGFTTL